MKVFWPTVQSSSTNDEFWSHEWEKHGSCALSMMGSQSNFFAAGIATRERVDLANGLRNAGVKMDQEMDFDDFKSAVKSVVGTDAVAIDCSGGKISGVRICASASSSPSIQDCPSKFVDSESCHGTIQWPSAGSSRTRMLAERLMEKQ